MAEKGGKSKKPKGDESGVLAALPATRPARLSNRPRTATTAPAPTAKSKAKAAPAKVKAKAAATPKAAARTKTAATPKAAAKTKAPARPQPKPVAPPAPTTLADTKPRPRPVRAGHPSLGEPAEKAAAQRSDAAHDGQHLVKTVVQAAGELASIGATLGGQVLKRVVEKLPRKP